jgi:hypothetical protein
LSFLRRTDSQMTQILIKKGLDLLNSYLPDEVKDRIFKSVLSVTPDNIITFSDENLVKAFMQIPKTRRVILSFMLSHFSR